MVVYGLAALVGVVAAVGGAVLFIQLGGASSTETIAAAADNPTSEDEAATDETAADGETNPVEANPVEANPTAAPQSAANSGEGEGESSPSVTAATKAGATNTLPPALRKFNAWKDPRTIQGFRSGGRVSLKGVWLAADGQGGRIGLKSGGAAPSAAVPSVETASSAPGSDAAPLAGATAPTASPVATLEPAVPPRYIVCQVEISNTGATPLKYEGWNGAASSAALLDESLAPLALAPASETPGVERLAAVFIPPGGSAIDTLVFRAPAKSVQTFHLALPQEAISTRADGYFGLLIPPEKLFEAPAASSAALAGGEVAGKPAGRKGSSAPPDFETLQRQINGGGEKAMDAAKGD
jgi:hypothetical protein